MRVSFLLRIVAVGACIGAAGISAGCSKRPGKDELSKLDEAKSASESAEKKLSDLKQERTQLESELQQKQNELNRNEAERDSLKQKLGK
jgi:outer membrane murein-binding lipoprotein Lpp